MIKQIHLHHFESHKNSTLEFEKGLNVLVGLTDAGKSGIFRALKWVSFGRPSGSWMLPLFSKHPGWTEVSVTLDNGTIVTRRKKGSKGEYEVNGKRLTGFGQDVPKDVQDVLKMQDVNFQSQIDLPFLMFDSPGERSRILNRVSGLDDIDRCLSAADSDMRRVRQTLETERETLEELRKEEKKFEDLDKREMLVSRAEVYEQAIESSSRICNRMEEYLNRLSKIEPRIRSISAIAKAENAVHEAQQIYRSIDELKTNTAILQASVKEYRQIEERIAEIAWCADEDLERSLKKASLILERLTKERTYYEKLSDILMNMERIENRIVNVQKDYDQLVQNIPRVCPACGRPMISQ